MDSPIRQYLKQKDYRRHKLFRKIKRRQAAERQLAIDEPIRQLKRKLKRYDGGKNVPMDRSIDGINLWRDDQTGLYFYQEGNGPRIDLTPFNTLGSDDPTTWSFLDAEGKEYNPRRLYTGSKISQTTDAQRVANEVRDILNTRTWRSDVADLLHNFGDALMWSTMAMNPEGEALMMKASEKVAPLGQLAKRLYNTIKLAPNFVPTLDSNLAGIRYAYSRNPELANIGTLEEYNDYIKTIFPESKVRDINYHMGPKGLQELKPSTGKVYNTNPGARGIYVTPDKSYAQKLRKYTTDRLEKPSFFTYIKRNLIPGGWDKANEAFTDIYPVMVDIKNPLLTKGDWTWGIKDKKYQSLMDVYDAIVNSGPKWYQNFNSMPETIVPRTEQSLILGSDRDVAEFKNFMSQRNITSENAANITPETIRLYHGSPVRFNTFSANFIGSGEGGSKVMRGINLWPEEKIGNAPKLANIKSPDAPMHLGVSSTPLGGELNPTVYDVLGKDLNLYKAAPREVKSLKQEDLVKQGYDGVQTPNQVTIFPESIHKLSIDKQSSIEDFVMSHPEVERWTPWTTDMQKMQNIIDMSRMSKYTPEQWTAAQDAAIARGDIAEAQRLRDLHFQVSAPNTVASVNGQPLQLYHGTNATFNTFDLSKYGSTDGGTFGRGVYTTPVKEYAELYGKNNMPLYMKLDNPRDYRNSSIGDLMAEKLAFGDDFATGNGIDGVIGRPSWKGFKGLAEYVAHNPKNIKSSLPITYSPDGTRIPLGSRDNFNINDIRYGLLAPLAGGTALFGYNSLGQPANTYKHGKDSGIHIKPLNRGKFTALKKRTGKSASWFKAHGTPALKKMATFALNSKHWSKKR